MVSLMRSTALLIALAVLAGCGSQNAPQQPAAQTPEQPAFQASAKTLDSMTAAVLQRTGALSGVGAALADLMAWAGKAGVAPEGPPFGLFAMPPTTPPDSNVYHVCLPVPAGTKPDGAAGIAIKPIGGIQLASTVHTGPYEKISATYEQLKKWIEGQGMIISGPAFEFYLNNPQTTPPESLRTEIAFQVQQPPKPPSQ